MDRELKQESNREAEPAPAAEASPSRRMPRKRGEPKPAPHPKAEPMPIAPVVAKTQAAAPLSDADFDALEQVLEASLADVDTTTDLLPRIQAYQETRRQILRKRPKAEKKSEDSYHHGNLRQSLISITMEQAEARGIPELSLRTIAKQAGVSAPALYRHFADKEALLAAVAEQGFSELHDWLVFAAPKEMACKARLRRFFEAYLEFMANYPVYFQLMFGPELQDRSRYPGLLTAHESSMSLLIELIVIGREQGVFSQQIPAEAQVLSCWSALHGYAGLSIMGMLGQEQLLDTLLQGLSLGLDDSAD